MKSGDPIGGFHSFATSSKGRILPATESTDNQGNQNLTNNTQPTIAAVNDKGPKTCSPRQAPGAEIYKDVCKGSAAKNQAYLSSILGKMFLDASGGDSCGWPGRNTDAGLAEFKLKLVIKKNKLELESILKSKPIKSMNLEHTWRLLSGLQKKIIKLEKIEDRKVLSVDGGDQQVQVNTDVVMEPAPLLGDDEGLSISSIIVWAFKNERKKKRD